MTPRFVSIFTALLIAALAVNASRGQDAFRRDCDGDGTEDSPTEVFRLAGTGAFSTGWVGSAPGPGEVGVFQSPDPDFTGCTYTVVLDGLPNQVGGLETRNVSVDFLPGSSFFANFNRLIVTDPVASCGGIVIGGLCPDDGPVATFRFDSIGVTTTGLRVGTEFGPGALELDEADLDSTEGPWRIGDVDRADVSLSGGAVLSIPPSTDVGVEAGVEATISAAESFVDLGSRSAPVRLSLGVRGSADLMLTHESAFVTSPTGASLSLVLGEFPGSRGALTVTGDGSDVQFGVAGTVVVGGEGSGRIAVLDGASFGQSVLEQAVVGLRNGADGHVIVSDRGSTFTSIGARLDVGRNGSGLLELYNGGTVNAPLLLIDRGGELAGEGLVSADQLVITGALSPRAAPGVPADASTTRELRLGNGFELQRDADPRQSETDDTGTLRVPLSPPELGQTGRVVSFGFSRVAGTIAFSRVARDAGPPSGPQTVVDSPQGLLGRFGAVQTPVYPGGLHFVPTYEPGGVGAAPRGGGRRPGGFAGGARFGAPDGERVDSFVSDVTGDGFPDQVFAITSGQGQPGRVIVQENLGLSAGGVWLGFAGPREFDSGAANPVAISSGDINGDERPDVVILHDDAGLIVVRVLLSSDGERGRAAFDLSDSLVYEFEGGVPLDIVSGRDFDGNGVDDVVFTWEIPNRFQPIAPLDPGGPNTPFRLTSDGRFTYLSSDGEGFEPVDVTTGGGPSTVDGGNQGVMGSVYVAVSSIDTNQIWLHRFNGSDGFFDPQQINVGTDPTDLAITDISGDDVGDTLNVDTGSGTVSFAVATDPPSDTEVGFDPANQLDARTDTADADPSSVVAIDSESSTRRDIAVIALNDDDERRVRILSQLEPAEDGALVFSTFVDLPEQDPSRTPESLDVADLDGDGTEDLVITYVEDAPAARGLRPLPDRDDIQVLLRAGVTPPCAADLTGDLLTDFFDVIALLAIYDEDNPNAAADLNRDGQNTASDIMTLLEGFDDCP